MDPAGQYHYLNDPNYQEPPNMQCRTCTSFMHPHKEGYVCRNVACLSAGVLMAPDNTDPSGLEDTDQPKLSPKTAQLIQRLQTWENMPEGRKKRDFWDLRVNHVVGEWQHAGSPDSEYLINHSFGYILKGSSTAGPNENPYTDNGKYESHPDNTELEERMPCPSCSGLEDHLPNCPTRGNGKLYIDPDVATWDSPSNPREDIERSIRDIRHPSLKLIDEALSGARGQDQILIAQVGLDWIALLLRKNIDYGSSVFEPPVLNPNMPAISAIEVRMSDKIKRLQTLSSQPAEVVSESIDDTYGDLGAYCLLRQVVKLKESLSLKKEKLDKQQ